MDQNNSETQYYILGFFRAGDELSGKIRGWRSGNIEKPIWANIFTIAFLFSRRDIKPVLKQWAADIFSPVGLWSFFPVFLGVALVYYGHMHGEDTRLWKGVNEVAAIWIMGSVSALFIFKTIVFREKSDMILAALAVSFLCREIHFAGTSRGVYIAISIIGVWTWLWRDALVEEVGGRKHLKIAVFCMVWSYFISIIIQRRLFKEKRIPILPDEHLVHVALEEVTENFAHAAFFYTGLAGLYYSLKNRKSVTKDKQNPD